MTLSDDIGRNMESLLEEWECFARKAQSLNANLDREGLRDRANGVLKAIATELRSERSEREEECKSDEKQQRPAARCSKRASAEPPIPPHKVLPRQE